MRGGRRGGLWSEKEIASSGTGSKRAQGRERSRGDTSASPGPREPALAAWQTTEALMLLPDEDPLFVGVGNDPPVFDPDAEVLPGPRERRQEQGLDLPLHVGGLAGSCHPFGERMFLPRAGHVQEEQACLLEDAGPLVDPAASHMRWVAHLLDPVEERVQGRVGGADAVDDPDQPPGLDDSQHLADGRRKVREMMGRDAAADPVERRRCEGKALRVRRDEFHVAAPPLGRQHPCFDEHLRREVGGDDLPHLERHRRRGVPAAGGYVEKEVGGSEGEAGEEDFPVIGVDMIDARPVPVGDPRELVPRLFFRRRFHRPGALRGSSGPPGAREDVLLVPSNELREHLLRRLAARGEWSAAGASILTLYDFAVRLLKYRGVFPRELPAAQASAAMLAAVREVYATGEGDFAAISGTPGFVPALSRTMADFEEGGLGEEAIREAEQRARARGDPKARRGAEGRRLFRAVEEKIAAAGGMSRRKIFQEAVAGFEQPGYPFRVTLYGFYDFTRLQWMLVDALLSSGILDEVYFPGIFREDGSLSPAFAYAALAWDRMLTAFEGNVEYLRDFSSPAVSAF